MTTVTLTPDTSNHQNSSRATNPVVKPHKQFIENFKLCMEFYEVDIEEARYERDRCLANMYDAERCYSVIAAGIRGIRNENK